MSALLGLIIALLVSSSCVQVETTPAGVSSKKVVELDFKSDMTEEELIQDLSRSSLLGEGIYDAVFLEATLQTPALDYSRLRKEIQARSFPTQRLKSKWQG